LDRHSKIGAATLASALVLTCLLARPALANDITPSFAGAPSGWSVDRYAPDGFSDVGTYQGINDVLGISIGSSGALANRPAGFQSQFYDTQGEGYSISGGVGSVIQAQLYIPSVWNNPTSGAVRTDMWGVMNNGTPNNITDYPIIGFTNSGTSGSAAQSAGSFTGFQVWDDNANGWVELTSTPVNYNSWNTLAIEFTGTDFLYFVNGTEVYDETNGNGAQGFQEFILQAYNFDDPTNIPGAVVTPYTADWANVPEPGSLLVLGSALMGLGAIRKRRASRVG